MGLPIMVLSSGEKLGTVADLLFDYTQHFRGILLETGLVFKSRKYIPTDHITAIGKDAVIVENEDVILPFDTEAESWMGMVSGARKLKGCPILLSNGCEMGMIENVYFLEEMGTLIGYELSDGMISDLSQGRKMLKTSDPLIWGKDCIIASADHVEIKDAR
ncbi:PRC-barrel domain-containing protein [Hazenella coriacea]|nr:PRC-barrel domain-containing protein [Hazenella coriacea]